MEYITCRDGIKGEAPDERPIGWFSWRMLAIRERLIQGRKYTIRHKSYLTGSGAEKMGWIVKTQMTLAEKYPHGALFHVDQGWNEFFTWQELAAGGLRGSAWI